MLRVHPGQNIPLLLEAGNTAKSDGIVGKPHLCHRIRKFFYQRNGCHSMHGQYKRVTLGSIPLGQ